MPWAYRTYVSPTGRPVVQQDIDRLTMEASVRFAAELRWLHEVPIQDWHEPHAKKLKGYKALYEIRFTANKKAMRPVGFFGPDHGQFSIVVWAFKKQNIYEPSDAFDTAERRVKEIRDGKATTAPLTVDGENVPEIEG